MNKKEMLLIISSFLMGGIIMFLFLFFCFPKEMVRESNSLSSIVEEVIDTVVEIKTEELNGSGFVYKTDQKYAYILTNEHVLKKEKVTILLMNDTEIEGTVLGKDANFDIAVIQIPKKKILKVATLGSSEKAKVGDSIFLIGTPLSSSYRGSVSSGIISGKDRFISYPNQELEQNIGIKVLQIDAPMNQGNSGGPLFNDQGEVIGICTSKVVDQAVEGVSFAIPIDDISSLLESLEKKEEIKRPTLGITMANLEDTSTLLKNEISVMPNSSYGVVVLSVKEDSNAFHKLEKGDIILEIDQQKIQNKTHLRYEINKHKIGDHITIKILRNEKEKKITIKLKEK